MPAEVGNGGQVGRPHGLTQPDMLRCQTTNRWVDQRAQTVIGEPMSV